MYAEFINNLITLVTNELVLSKSLLATLANLTTLRDHLVNKQMKQGGSILSSALEFETIDSAYKYRLRVAVISADKYKDFQLFMNDVKPIFIEGLKRALIDLQALKFQSIFYAKLKMEKEGVKKFDEKHFVTENFMLFKADNLEEIFDKIRSNISTLLGEFETRESGWTLRSLLNLSFFIGKLNQIKAGCY